MTSDEHQELVQLRKENRVLREERDILKRAYSFFKKPVLRPPLEPSQYTSGTFRKLLTDHHITQSLSRPGQCSDNAVAESWFSTLKEELICRQVWPTRVQARRAIFEFIEVFYNREGLHSSLGNLTPVEYERRRKDQSHTDTQAA